MADIILKIYSTTTNWADTLDYTLRSGDIIDYQINDQSNYQIDTATFRVTKRFENLIGIDFTNAGSETTQVWRAHSKDGTLINSGVIKSSRIEGNYLILDCIGMTELLRRRIIKEEFFQTKDNNGNAWTSEDVLVDSGYGLIPKYLGSIFGSIDLSTYVDTPNSTITKVIKWDGITLYDACLDVAKSSYGTNNRPFDIYLFETLSGGSYSLNLYFKEQNSNPATPIILRTGNIDPSGFNIGEQSFQNFNRIIIRGEPNPNALNPKDGDGWTENITDWDEDDPSSVITLSRQSEQKFGNFCIRARRTNTSNQASFFYNPGTQLANSKYDRIAFSVFATQDTASTSRKRLYISLGVKDKYGNARTVQYALGSSIYYILEILSYPSGSDPDDFEWVDYDLPLPKPNNANGWEQTTLSFPNSGLNAREWEQIHQVGFILSQGTGDEIEDLYVDGLRFLGRDTFEGTYPVSVPTFPKEGIFSIPGLKSNTDCANFAQQLYQAFRTKNFEGSITLSGARRKFSLKAGDRITIKYPLKGINETVPIQNIIYTPTKQVLQVGRRFTQAEIINETKRKIRISDQII